MKNSVLLLCLLFVATYARVGFGPGDQDWGYVEVREKAHLFWWLYYTTADVSSPTERPLFFWLQGGPGSSSTGFGNFGELGPLDHNLEPRNFTWVKDANVIFVDNPVGTGFSYVDDYSALAKTNRQIADDFLVLVQGILEKLPEFRNVPIYIMSESYGGKMTAEIALVLNEAIEAGTLEANLGGVGLGDSWISPIDSVLTWAPYLLHVGAVDQAGHDAINASAYKTKAAIDNGMYELATSLWGSTESVVESVTGGIDFYNILTKSVGYGRKRKLSTPDDLDEIDEKVEVIMTEKVNVALNLTSTWGAQSGRVFNTLSEDFMKPVVDIVEELLNKTDVKVAVYNGQLDLIVDTPGTVKWVEEMNWINKTKWDSAPRNTLVVDHIVEGYVKKTGNLAFYWINRAGHMVPSDNPVGMEYILRDISKNYTVS